MYYYGVGSLHNDESSVDGGKYIRLPLMEEMHNAGIEINWIGFKRDGQVDNKYLELMGLYSHEWFISCEEYVRDMHTLFINDEGNGLTNVASPIVDRCPGALFIELRPDIDKPGYNFKNEYKVQTELIELFHSKGLPVFVWDQDVWAHQMSDELKKKVVLLRSYFEPVEGFPKQELFLYGWSHLCESELTSLKWDHSGPLFDAVYCGNVYGRRDDFIRFFKPFHDASKRVCIQGNWLRKKYDDRDFALDNFPNFMFFGRTPHWSTLPSIALSKSVIQFSNEAQQEVGLPTARIFETLMGGSVVFCSDKIKHVDQVVPKELIFSSAEDLFEKWTEIDENNRWEEIRELFEEKLMTDEFSYKTRVKELLGFIDKYYA